MSTGALLILATRLRDHGCAERRHARPDRVRAAARPGPSVFSSHGRAAGPGLVYRRALGLAILAGLILPSLVASTARAQAQAQTPVPARSSAAPLQLDTLRVEAGPVVRIGGTPPPPGPCVQVDIAGHKAGHLDCATQALQEAARISQAQARSALDTPVPKAGSPDVTVGVSSLSGSRLRMGNALGNSVHPQRPNRPVPPPRGGGRP